MILVTGGTGLVGSHLLYELVKLNKSVKAIIRNRDKIQLVKKVFSYYSEDPDGLINKIQWIDGDVLDVYSMEDAFNGVKKVYHCAAIVSIGGKNKDELLSANIQGTENIVNLCIDHKINKLCHVSSIASLGESLNGDLITENTKWNASKNRSAYSVSKYKSEMEVWRGIQEGLNAVIVNPSVILGPGFWNSGIGSLFTRAAKGLKYYTAGSTGFVDVRDVSEVMIKLMESDISSERFIINSENLVYKTLFDQIAEVMQVKKPKKKATKNLLIAALALDSIASMFGFKKKEITKDVIRASLSTSKYSNEKIKNTIGQNFISIKESIQDVADKFNKELTIN
ncbi:NAD-dependent epimerase/dehydratase family protein [Bacteroidota bacterium]